MQAIASGYRPVWDEKWLAFMEDDCLFLHRCGTGHGIFEAIFAAQDGGFVVTSARVETDPRRYKENFDPIEERDFLRALIVDMSKQLTPRLLSISSPANPVLEAVLGDITTQSVDAIVNAANRRLVVGSGVNGAIHQAAGPELLAYCKFLGGCPIGRAKVTPGFRLAARWIIHTVGPRWRGGGHGEPVLLESCYRESLALADEVGAGSVAFPAIGTGAYGYPLDAAARIAVETIRSILTKVRLIRFVCIDRTTLEAFRFPLEDTT